MAGEIPKLWSKLDNAGDVTAPQRGTGGTVTGAPTFEPAKFNNGIYATFGKFARFPTVANGINANKGTIEFWAKLKFPYPTPGTDSQFFFTFRSAAAGGGIELHYSQNTDKWYVQAYYEDYAYVLLGPVTLIWNEDDLVHFGVTWDRQGIDIGDGKTLVLKVSNEEKASSIQTWDPAGCSADLHIGCSSGGVKVSDAVIDNLKTYGICKTDFSDRDIEGVVLVADFSGTPTSGYGPLAVQFTDLSIAEPTSWLWSFGDGETSTEQNPEHTYDEPGVYTVTLTATNAAGSDDEVKTDYIEVLPTIGANFSAQPLTGKYPLTVHFTDLSLYGPTSWLWNFGDREISQEQNPTHIYKEAGLYTVSLTATNEAGSDTETKFGYIEAIERSFIEKRGIEERQQMKIRHISLKRGLAIAERIPIRVIEVRRDPAPKRIWK